METHSLVNTLLTVLLSSIGVFVAASILPGIHIADYGTAVMVAVVFGLLNAFIRPIIFILTLPINILTLGLFTFVIIAGMVFLVSKIVPGFIVDGFWWAIAFAFVLWVINAFLFSLVPNKKSF